jgi:hypothetical protein
MLAETLVSPLILPLKGGGDGFLGTSRERSYIDLSPSGARDL